MGSAPALTAIWEVSLWMEDLSVSLLLSVNLIYLSHKNPTQQGWATLKPGSGSSVRVALWAAGASGPGLSAAALPAGSFSGQLDQRQSSRDSNPCMSITLTGSRQRRHILRHRVGPRSCATFSAAEAFCRGAGSGRGCLAQSWVSVRWRVEHQAGLGTHWVLWQRELPAVFIESAESCPRVVPAFSSLGQDF